MKAVELEKNYDPKSFEDKLYENWDKEFPNREKPIIYIAGMDNEGGKHLLELLTRRIGAICMHTNLDAADGGVNDALASRIGLHDVHPVFKVSERQVNGVE